MNVIQLYNYTIIQTYMKPYPDAGVKHIIIPKYGKKSMELTKSENTTTFKRLKRWRAGIEGRISCLKRHFGLNRSMLQGYQRS
jgi:transposase, IS5 family